VQFRSGSLFFVNFAEVSLRPLRSKALKALDRKAREVTGTGAMKLHHCRILI
jgi:hypothetical protein